MSWGIPSRGSQVIIHSGPYVIPLVLTCHITAANFILPRAMPLVYSRHPERSQSSHNGCPAVDFPLGDLRSPLSGAPRRHLNLDIERVDGTQVWAASGEESLEPIQEIQVWP